MSDKLKPHMRDIRRLATKWCKVYGIRKDEAVSELCLRAYARIDTWDPERGSFYVYFGPTARYALSRLMPRETSNTLDDMPEPVQEEDTASETDMRDLFTKVLMSVPVEDRLILSARAAGYTYQWIADKLDVSHQTVHQRATKLMDRLKKNTKFQRAYDDIFVKE